MNSWAAMAILVGILALVLIGAFLLIWRRDQTRSHEVADDPSRFTADSRDRSPDQ